MEQEKVLQQLDNLFSRQSSTLSKQVRVEQTLRQAVTQIWSGATRLPGHRTLAKTLSISRHTLAGAINTLIKEELLVTHHGKGTWSTHRASDIPSETPEPRLSLRAQRVLRDPGAGMVQSGSFVPGIPDIARFPIRKWRQLYASVTVPQNALLLSYSTGGYGPLKRAIRDFLQRWRRIDCDIEQIIITDGTHNGMQLCAMALADAGDTVAIESPCYWGARKVFTASNLELEMISWTPGTGHVLPESSRPIQLAYLMGGHHYPLSVPTCIEDKRHLCQALDPAYIIEDDYEFSQDDHVNLLFDPRSDRHILAGSFSKMIFPGLRLGYLVVPKHLASPLNRLRSELFREGRMLDQAVLAQFIFDGDLDAWCRRIQREYLGRQQVVHDHLKRLPNVRHISPPSHAISLCIEFESQVDDVAIARSLLKEHLVVRPLSTVCADTDLRSGLILGVGMLSGETLKHEVKRLIRHLNLLIK
ncbi:PLP-dependent aminotransferase family protein [Marinobacter changyiensis]|uniref:aminotransferase-like domain-containing protein n=1 Tax=Marinobacter changyiensis TaxID=2604091 RepID=UPI001264098F|nr:PLP-dependent aminotransferase family protein [Marinobacter changyiensis]